MLRTCILLNADYSYLNNISWRNAFRLLGKGKTEVLKYSDEVIKCANGMIRKIPLVMRLIKLIRTLYKAKVPYSSKNVMIRDGYVCQYCGLDFEGKTKINRLNKNTGNMENIVLTVDHIVPKDRGGKSSFENCVAACFPCNNKKGHKLCNEVKMYPKVRAYAPTISQFLIMKMNKLGIDKVIKDIFNNE